VQINCLTVRRMKFLLARDVSLGLAIAPLNISVHNPHRKSGTNNPATRALERDIIESRIIEGERILQIEDPIHGEVVAGN